MCSVENYQSIKTPEDLEEERTYESNPYRLFQAYDPDCGDYEAYKKRWCVKTCQKVSKTSVERWRRRMTDKEKAKRFREDFVCSTKKYIGKDNYECIEEAYLAGLHEGQPKWHDLRKDPNDLPKRDERFCTNISVPVLTQTSGFAFYQFDDKKWYYQGKVVDVIAWCEIPQFKE